MTMLLAKSPSSSHKRACLTLVFCLRGGLAQRVAHFLRKERLHDEVHSESIPNSVFTYKACKAYDFVRPQCYCTQPLVKAVSPTFLSERQVEHGFGRTRRFFSVHESAGMRRDEHLHLRRLERDGAVGGERVQLLQRLDGGCGDRPLHGDFERSGRHRRSGGKRVE